MKVMEFLNFIVFCFLMMVLTCEKSSCNPIPVTPDHDNHLDDTSTNKENEDDQLSLKNKISGCYLEMYLIIINDNKEELSDACKSLFEITNKCKDKNCAEKLLPSLPLPTSPDLQSELQSLSQLNEIEADYGEVKRDGPQAGQFEKKSTKEKNGLETEAENSKAKQAEEVPSVDDDVDDDEALDFSLDTPFMTSSKDDKEDFLVIPINYLKNELKAAAAVDGDENDPQILKNSGKVEEKENAKSASKVLARDGGESVNDGDDLSSLEAALAAMQDRSHNDNSDAEDTLSSFEVDITRLAEDLKNLKSKNVF